MTRTNTWLARVLCFAAVVFLACIPHAARAQGSDMIIFAAASLKNALDNINHQWRKETGKAARISYSASSVLAKQIELGAPAQLFISADERWMDFLANKDLIKKETRFNLLGNRLVLIAPKERVKPVDIETGFDLASLLGDGRLAVANTEVVPAGRYAKAALEKLGAWDSVSNKLAQAENVRAALLLVSRGEAPLGIVYQTDAAADAHVGVVGVFPETAHPPIVYPVALTNLAHPDAAAFVANLKSARVKVLFEAQGFTVFDPGRS